MVTLYMVYIYGNFICLYILLYFDSYKLLRTDNEAKSVKTIYS